MTTTLTIDEEGRLLLPKKILARMHLSAGSKLSVSYSDDKLELSAPQSDVRIERRDDGLPVVVGWHGFDAAKAVREMREDQVERLVNPRRDE